MEGLLTVLGVASLLLTTSNVIAYLLCKYWLKLYSDRKGRGY